MAYYMDAYNVQVFRDTFSYAIQTQTDLYMGTRVLMTALP